MSLAELQKRLEIAQEACRAAGAIQLGYRVKAFAIETKSSGIDLVTTADRESDEVIRHLLTEGCREAGLKPSLFLTEETFEEEQEIDLSDTWVVDPLDGTTNFAHGFPHFAVAIAYMKDGIPMVGAVYDPSKDEMFTAIRGQGVFLNGQPIRVSTVSTLDTSLLATGFPYDTHVKPKDNMAYFLAFMTICHGVRRAGAAALDLSYLACGRVDGFWELRLSPWDVCAGALFIEEAGGLVSDFAGKPLDFSLRRIDILGANNDGILQEIITVCRETNCPAV